MRTSLALIIPVSIFLFITMGDAKDLADSLPKDMPKNRQEELRGCLTRARAAIQCDASTCIYLNNGTKIAMLRDKKQIIVQGLANGDWVQTLPDHDTSQCILYCHQEGKCCLIANVTGKFHFASDITSCGGIERQYPRVEDTRR